MHLQYVVWTKIK